MNTVIVGQQYLFQMTESVETVVGTRGFEPPTPRTPSVCATRLRYVPTQGANLAPAIQDCQDVPELNLHLIKLFGRWTSRLGLGFGGAANREKRCSGIVLPRREHLSGSGDSEPAFVKQTLDRDHHLDILPTVHPSTVGTLGGRQCRELRFPETEHIRLQLQEPADLSDAEVQLVRNLN